MGLGLPPVYVYIGRRRSRETVSGPQKTISMLVLMPILVSTIAMPLQNSDIDIKDTKICIKTSIGTVFSGPETVSLDLLLPVGFSCEAVSGRALNPSKYVLFTVLIAKFLP